MDKAVGLRRYGIPVWWLLLTVAFLAPSTSAAQGTPVQASDYTGEQVCSDCHFVLFTQFQKTPMSVLFSEKKYPLEQRGCEGICHGPGRVHAEMEWAKREVEERAKRTPPPTPIPSEAELKEMALTRLLGPPGRWRYEKTDQEVEVKDQTYNPIRYSPKENSVACQSCHEKDEKTSLFRRSRHLGAGVPCLECHSAHLVILGEDVAKPSPALESHFSVPKQSMERSWLESRLLREGQPKLCYSCHRDVEAEFQLPVRHRVNEGLVQCTDCHNPHGTLTAGGLKATGTDACNTCHVEKRGPFVYEHASVRVEGCTGCHTPHGSINLHLLKRRQERQLCLECNVAPQSINVPHPRLGFQTTGECTRCHIDIHGSNYQKQFLR